VSLTLLSLASEAAKRGILQEKTRLACGRLKEKIAAWANSDVTIFDEIYMPDSRRRWIIDATELRPRDDLVTVRSMASALAESLRQDVLRGSLGISLRRLVEIDAQLKALT
jgi:phosphoribosylaminoimidazole-succinocarboxamide synthase